MDISGAEQSAILAILVAVSTVVTAMAGIFVTYLKAKEAQIEAHSKPTHDDVQVAIDKKVAELQEASKQVK